MNRPEETPSIKSLGSTRKVLLDTLRAYPDAKTIDDINRQLEALDADKLKTLQAFLNADGWKGRVPEDKIRVLKTRLGIVQTLQMAKLKKTGSDPQITDSMSGEPAQKSADPVITAPTVTVEPKKTRRAPQSPPRVSIARYQGRTAEGRRH